MVGQKNLFPSSFSAVVVSGWIKIRIRDKHPESATLLAMFKLLLGTPARPTGRGQTVKPPPLIQLQHAQAKGKRAAAPQQLPYVGIAQFLNSGPDLKPVAKKLEFHDLALPGRGQ
jgi:hypothetical protein